MSSRITGIVGYNAFGGERRFFASRRSQTVYTLSTYLFAFLLIVVRTAKTKLVIQALTRLLYFKIEMENTHVILL